MRIYMQTPAEADKAPRFYQLMIQEDLLEGWTLVREWGAQGSPGRVKRDHYPTFPEAAAAMERARDAQIRRGYRVVFAEGHVPGR